MEVDPPEASPGAKGPAEALVNRLDLALAAALDGADGGTVQLAEFTRLAAELKALLGEGGKEDRAARPVEQGIREL